jgi:GNAT superfamily N-acetyltransferase
VSSGYAIRPARPGDLAALPEIERAAAALFAEFGLAERFAAVLTGFEHLESGCAAGRLWVATDAAGVPVGFALASLLGDAAHLDELDVHPDHGRRGLGRALVAEVVAWARAQGFAAITLTTLRQVPWNAPFYESLGFHVLADAGLSPELRALLREEIERGLPAEQRVAMRKEL